MFYFKSNSVFNNDNLRLLIGALLGFLYILLFFGLKIEPKTEPKIKINIGNFIQNSHITLFNKHIHHWLINLVILIVVLMIELIYSNKYFNFIKGFNIILILHGLTYDDALDFSC